jgi:hypothetical protein
VPCVSCLVLGLAGLLGAGVRGREGVGVGVRVRVRVGVRVKVRVRETENLDVSTYVFQDVWMVVDGRHNGILAMAGQSIFHQKSLENGTSLVNLLLALSNKATVILTLRYIA